MKAYNGEDGHVSWVIKPPSQEAGNWKMIEATWTLIHLRGDKRLLTMKRIDKISDQFARFHATLKKPGLLGGQNLVGVGPTRPKWAVNSYAVFALRPEYIELLVLKDSRLAESMMAAR